MRADLRGRPAVQRSVGSRRLHAPTAPAQAVAAAPNAAPSPEGPSGLAEPHCAPTFRTMIRRTTWRRNRKPLRFGVPGTPTSCGRSLLTIEDRRVILIVGAKLRRPRLPSQ